MLATVQFLVFSIPTCHLKTRRLKYTELIMPVFSFGKTDTFPYANMYRDSVFGITTVYWLDAPGIESRWG